MMAADWYAPCQACDHQQSIAYIPRNSGRQAGRLSVCCDGQWLTHEALSAIEGLDPGRGLSVGTSSAFKLIAKASCPSDLLRASPALLQGVLVREKWSRSRGSLQCIEELCLLWLCACEKGSSDWTLSRPLLGLNQPAVVLADRSGHPSK